jgi:hypothetical protein
VSAPAENSSLVSNPILLASLVLHLFIASSPAVFCFPLLLLLLAHSFSAFGFGQRVFFFFFFPACSPVLLVHLFFSSLFLHNYLAASFGFFRLV